VILYFILVVSTMYLEILGNYFSYVLIIVKHILLHINFKTIDKLFMIPTNYLDMLYNIVCYLNFLDTTMTETLK